MYNYLYLMADEKRDYCLFKVGFTTDIKKRMHAYTTHNPEAKCISTVLTKVASGRKVETAFHKEIEKRGYRFVTATIDGKRTEWFSVPYTDTFYNELMSKGLNAFGCGKRRHNMGMLHL